MGLLVGAFNLLINMQGRAMVLTRPAIPNPVFNISVKAAPSNYFVNGSGPAQVIIEGREFVIRALEIKAANIKLKRGDRLIDPELGTLTLDQIREMYDLGGDIIGYRVRVE